MNNLIKIGIRNENPERHKIINEIFNLINKKIKDKKGYYFSTTIEDYNLLKYEFDDCSRILKFEKSNEKALTKPNKNIILFNNSFFSVEVNKIEKESVFLHEIGHIVNNPNSIQINNDIIYFYNEYLADKFLFEIDEVIFKKGRVESDLNKISAEELKINVEKGDNKEGLIKGQFTTIIKLTYYDDLYKDETIKNKIDSLISVIREYFQDIEFVFNDLEVFCNSFNSKSELELYELSQKIHNNIINLKM